MPSDDASPVSRRSMLGGLAAISTAALAGCSGQSSLHTSAECDYCGRAEDFEYEDGARAWLFEHIVVEHADELPDFEGTA